MKSLFDLSITPDLDESNAEIISRMSDTLDGVGTDQEWPPKLVYLVNLCVEEIGLNALTHGRRHGLDRFTVKVTSNDGAVSIEFVDNGAPFDPLNDAPEPNLSVPLEERSLGGLGIYLIKTMVDQIEYHRLEETNHLKLVVGGI